MESVVVNTSDLSAGNAAPTEQINVEISQNKYLKAMSNEHSAN